jgi:hypothetical protein
MHASGIAITLRILSATSFLMAASALAGPAPLPVIDNERVTVWEVTLNKGDPGPPTPHAQSAVIMFLEGGTIRTAGPDGTSSTAHREFGDAVFVPRGSDASDVLISDGTAREIVIALKDAASPVIRNDSGLPPAFPRPGSVKALENERVVVWHYSWSPGVPTPMHFHDKDVVVAYRYDAALRSTTPDGASVVNTFTAGEVRFNKANRAHSELLTTPRESAVMAELK